MLGPQHPLVRRQRPLIQWLGFLISALGFVDSRQKAADIDDFQMIWILVSIEQFECIAEMARSHHALTEVKFRYAGHAVSTLFSPPRRFGQWRFKRRERSVQRLLVVAQINE